MKRIGKKVFWTGIGLYALHFILFTFTAFVRPPESTHLDQEIALPAYLKFIYWLTPNLMILSVILALVGGIVWLIQTLLTKRSEN